MNLEQKINAAYQYIQNQLNNFTPTVGLILGSGLGDLAEEIENPIYISYHDIPGFLQSTVQGHKGRLVVGTLQGKKVIAMQGRFHFYEGYPIAETTIPTRVMAKLGVEQMIITNAAGAVNETFEPGDLMLITDHINFANVNPLIGHNLDDFGPRFPDTSQAYNSELLSIAKNTAKMLNIKIREGVYQFSSGPTYETPSETKVARYLGADVVGMSTVPEVMVAVHSGIKVLGISCVTNMAAGILDQPLNHEEVIETSALAKEKFISLVKNILKNS